MRHCYVLSKCVTSSLDVYHSPYSFYVDLKASGEEGKVPVRGDECGPASNTAAQAKEEGWQDGLRLPCPGCGGALSPWQGMPSSPSPCLICTASLHSFPFH